MHKEYKKNRERERERESSELMCRYVNHTFVLQIVALKMTSSKIHRLKRHFKSSSDLSNVNTLCNIKKSLSTFRNFHIH